VAASFSLAVRSSRTETGSPICYLSRSAYFKRTYRQYAQAIHRDIQQELS